MNMFAKNHKEENSITLIEPKRQLFMQNSNGKLLVKNNNECVSPRSSSSNKLLKNCRDDNMDSPLDNLFG